AATVVPASGTDGREGGPAPTIGPGGSAPTIGPGGRAARIGAGRAGGVPVPARGDRDGRGAVDAAGDAARRVPGTRPAPRRGDTGGSPPATGAAPKRRCRVAALRGVRSTSQAANAASTTPHRHDQSPRNQSQGTTIRSTKAVMVRASSSAWPPVRSIRR